MKRTKLFVFDVNTLVSAFIIGSDTISSAFDKAIEIGRIVISSEIYFELQDVFLRVKFDRFASLESRINLLKYLDRQFLIWPKDDTVFRECRDPKDDKYLELAVSCGATCIITGDKDLLVMSPFQKIPIITAAEFLSAYDDSLIVNESSEPYIAKQ